MKKCTICLDEIQISKMARLENCEHIFCYECIDQWAKSNSNKCPNCKMKFDFIIFKNVLNLD